MLNNRRENFLCMSLLAPTNSLPDASCFEKRSGAALRYLTVHNERGSAFAYYCEPFRKGATAAQSCPRQRREILRRLGDSQSRLPRAEDSRSCPPASLDLEVRDSERLMAWENECAKRRWHQRGLRRFSIVRNRQSLRLPYRRFRRHGCTSATTRIRRTSART